MYLTKILSQWILSQWLFSMWALSQFISTQWETFVFGSLPWIIALLGVISAFFGPYLLWRQQQKKELKTIANAFIIDLDRTYDQNRGLYINYKKQSEFQFQTTGDVLPDRPFYNANGAYYLFNQKIYMFDYDLTSKILKFYDVLLKAESNRVFVYEHMKPTNKMDFDDITTLLIDISNKQMKRDIIITEEQIPSLREQLKKVIES